MNIKSIEKSVYKIKTAYKSGTGFSIKGKQMILTNCHVIEPCLQVCIETVLGEKDEATVILIDQKHDLAILIPKNIKIEVGLDFEKDIPVSQGCKIFVAGFPFGLPFSLTEGIVSVTNQKVNQINYIQTDAATNPGNSGGPLLNEKGNVIGITCSKHNQADRIGFNLPQSSIESFINIYLNENLKNTKALCDSCNALLDINDEYCQYCGVQVNYKHFNQMVLSELAIYCEDILLNANINPIIARAGNEFWEVNLNNNLLKVMLHNTYYVIVEACITKLPKENLQSFFEELLSENKTEFWYAIDKNELYVSYRFYITDIYTKKTDIIKANINKLIQSIEEIDLYFKKKYNS